MRRERERERDSFICEGGGGGLCAYEGFYSFVVVFLYYCSVLNRVHSTGLHGGGGLLGPCCTARTYLLLLYCCFILFFIVLMAV